MYTHPHATTDSAHPSTLTLSNGNIGGYPMYHSNNHTNSYANGHTRGNEDGHSMDMDNPSVVMRRPSPLEYPFITVKAFQVVRLSHRFFRINANNLSSSGLHA